MNRYEEDAADAAPPPAEAATEVGQEDEEELDDFSWLLVKILAAAITVAVAVAAVWGQ